MDGAEVLSVPQSEPAPEAPFCGFAPPLHAPGALRRAISAACRRPEAECLAPLLEAATLPPELQRAVAESARRLILALRAKPRRSMVEELVGEYGLSSREGVALMCLAEALLRIPDPPTRDALIRDKIGGGDWQAHLGRGRSVFVNAATWGLMLTGRLSATADEPGLLSALGGAIGRCGAPVVRRAMDVAVGLMGEQFVMGETIAAALARAQAREARGFRHSYDMLGEAAVTAADAERYLADYRDAIHAIGAAAAGRGIHDGPGISIKLSALHPRYARAQAERVAGELLPRAKALAALARSYDIALSIDAEEADRLELSLDILEALAADPDLAGWNGLGFVVQAYGRRCPFVLDVVIDLARRTGRRIMVRLVKGAYWDAEIKRAQVDGLSDFPVFTRKAHTDVCYIACARRLLAAPDAVFPQFATHNAQTLATILHLAGAPFVSGSYEFQCLHGMGEPLYEEVVGPEKLGRPCRIYAPVGSHETLLAYLVRRLLENGANSNFVHRIADPKVPVEALIADPVAVVRAEPDPGAPHAGISPPPALFGARRNSAGIDLASDAVLAALSHALRDSAATPWRAAPAFGQGPARAVRNPGDHRDLVGEVVEATGEDIRRALADAADAAPGWAAEPVARRAAILLQAADALEARMPRLMGLVMREAGKTAASGLAEVREAVDFLRYYALGAQATSSAASAALGPVACISPWNFPLAIFTGQVAAALAMGNTVLAKPAQETPLIAAEAVRLLHAAGVPPAALQLLPGDGMVGAALVAAPQVAGVMFTGSTEVARAIQATLAERLSPAGTPVPLVAETGGQNAMVVDSSALPEQVVADVVASAFDSAGQRCSALRVLCLQEEAAGRILGLLDGAMAELEVGRTDRLAVDVGPVITAEARANIEAHVARMAARGHRVVRRDLPPAARHGTFVAPTLIEIDRLDALAGEVFGPVLHVLRYRRADLGPLLDAIAATGYGLTFGIHSRLDATVDHVLARIGAGNRYVNRNIIGAVVGVQPFGGRGLSGTGPKAGGPLYLRRLARQAAASGLGGAPDAAAEAFAGWLEARGFARMADGVRASAAGAPLGAELELPGPVGERNTYRLEPRGTVLALPQSWTGLCRLAGIVLATGNRLLLDTRGLTAPLPVPLGDLPPAVGRRIAVSADWDGAGPLAAAAAEGEGTRIVALARALAARPGPIVTLHAASADALATDPAAIDPVWLLEEVSTSVNTAAAGGNASLMALS